MGWWAELIATFCAGLLAGGVLLATVEPPLRLAWAARVAQAPPRRAFTGTRLRQASLALLGGLSATLAFTAGGGFGWLAVAALQVVLAALALAAQRPCDGALLERGLARAPGPRPLLTRGGRLHSARTVVAAAAFATALASLLR